MPRRIPFFVCLVTILSAAAFAQSPVAYVYVTGLMQPLDPQINAFSVAPSGELTPVEGSPFAALTSGSMVVNPHFLFGTDGASIYSFSIASNGSLTPVFSVNVQQFNGNCGGPGPLFIDRTGSTLYDLDFYGSQCLNNSYQAFDINQSTGALTNLGLVGAPNDWFFEPLSFIGNNMFAYGVDCLGDMYWTTAGFQRNDDGTLTELPAAFKTPVPKSGDFYCPTLTAPDSTNHLAVSVQAVGPYLQQDGPPQLATYTAMNDSPGIIVTGSTYANMPSTAVQNVSDIAMSPSGRLLAVSGTQGFQVFHFNGSSPITPYTALLAPGTIVDQLCWDNNNHLFAISHSANKLWVLTVTPASVIQAPGSPYTITQPSDIVTYMPPSS